MKLIIKYFFRKLKNYQFFTDIFNSLNSLNNYENESFLNSSYQKRVNKIMHLHNLNTKKLVINNLDYSNKDYFKKNIETDRKIVSDLIVSLANETRPKSFMQLGSWYLGEIQALKIFGFKGRLIGSDFSEKFLNILKTKISNSFLKDIQLRKVNIESCSEKNFLGVEMLSAVQVMSNIQPEGIKKFFNVLKKTKVKTMVISDIYSAESIRTSKSILLKNKLNWCHPYHYHAKVNGFKFYMVPDFTFDTYTESRAIFVVYRHNSLKKHKKAFLLAYDRILERSSRIKW